MAALTDLGVGEAAAKIRRGEITAEGLAAALLARSAKHSDLNAFITLDTECVLAAARAADRQRAAGETLGALQGVPIVLKDNLDTAGLPTTGGTPGLKGHRPDRNAPVVAALVEAGAIVLGKANMHELAFGITNNNAGFGAARNPFDRARIPGGSSGGTAVAVAARLAPGGVGTDTGGSVRVPAALCGIVGFRPTVGRWPQRGIVPISHTRDTAGPMARSVADCAVLDSVVAGPPTAFAPMPLRGLRLGLPRRHFWEDLDTGLAGILEERLRQLRDAGAVLIEADLPDVPARDAAAGFPIALHEVATDLGRYLAEHQTGLDLAGLAAQIASPDVRAIIGNVLSAAAVPDAVYRQALDVDRPAVQEAYRRYFRGHDVRAVLLPTTPLPAARIGEDETVLLNGQSRPTFITFIRNTDPGSIAGVPGLSLPAGLTAAGLPVGLEIDGPAGSDRELLAIGAALERILPRPPAPPI